MKMDIIQEFREDHRRVRDGLLELSDALTKGDAEKAKHLLGALNTLVGPHFRYEEDALYPALRQFLGEYVDKLLLEHDVVIGTAKAALQLLDKGSISEKERINAIKAARALLIHVSNCDGLSILTERLSSDDFDQLTRKYSEARRANVSLLEWADKIRARR